MVELWEEVGQASKKSKEPEHPERRGRDREQRKTVARKKKRATPQAVSGNRGWKVRWRVDREAPHLGHFESHCGIPSRGGEPASGGLSISKPPSFSLSINSLAWGGGVGSGGHFGPEAGSQSISCSFESQLH